MSVASVPAIVTAVATTIMSAHVPISTATVRVSTIVGISVAVVVGIVDISAVAGAAAVPISSSSVPVTTVVTASVVMTTVTASVVTAIIMATVSKCSWRDRQHPG
jgi:hypothetical protein